MPETSVWPVPDNPLDGEVGGIDLWRVSALEHAAHLDQLFQSLSHAEQERAIRFHKIADRRRYICAHAALRSILGIYLHLPPQLVPIHQAAGGKPALQPDLAIGPLHFNLTHAGELALCAVSRTVAVGVDMEQLQLDFHPFEIAWRYFSPGEVAALSALPLDEQTPAFFELWTGKEAILKATGEGLAGKLIEFKIEFHPEQPAALHTRPEDAFRAAGWNLIRLAPEDGYTAAVAYHGPAREIRTFHWPGLSW